MKLSVEYHPDTNSVEIYGDTEGLKFFAKRILGLTRLEPGSYFAEGQSGVLKRKPTNQLMNHYSVIHVKP